MKKRSILLLLAMILAFLFLIQSLDAGYSSQGKSQLEAALRRTAVSCYASEGFYPPDLAYMRTHYGLQYDESRYTVHYTLFAANLMPDITVLEALP